MSINDPVIVSFNDKWGWVLTRGRETFYDDERYLRAWDTRAEAEQWAMANLWVRPIDPPEDPPFYIQQAAAEDRQIRMDDL